MGSAHSALGLLKYGILHSGGPLCMDAVTEHDPFMLSAAFIVSAGFPPLKITTAASRPGQMHIKSLVVLYVSESLSESASSLLCRWPMYSLTMNRIIDHMLLGHVQDWQLLCVCLILFIRHV